jgi:hypothetical protein
MCLISDVWNWERKSTWIKQPLLSLVAERTLVIRCLQAMNQQQFNVKMLKTEYLATALRAGVSTMTDCWKAVSGEDDGKWGLLEPRSEELSPKGGADDCAGAGDARAANKL